MYVAQGPLAAFPPRSSLRPVLHLPPVLPSTDGPAPGSILLSLWIWFLSTVSSKNTHTYSSSTMLARSATRMKPWVLSLSLTPVLCLSLTPHFREQGCPCLGQLHSCDTEDCNLWGKVTLPTDRASGFRKPDDLQRWKPRWEEGPLAFICSGHVFGCPIIVNSEIHSFIHWVLYGTSIMF